jgi:hypothetical protein
VAPDRGRVEVGPEDLVDPLMGGTGGKPLFDSLAAA